MNNPSDRGSDGCTSKRFKIVSEEEEYRWSLPADMTEYANENSKTFIPDNVKEAILLKLPRQGNIDPVKKLDYFLLELLKQKKKTVDLTIDGAFEKIQDKVTYIIGLLSKLWVMIENAYSEKDSNVPVV